MSLTDSFDLRPLLARGIDPLSAVVDRAKGVEQGGRLTLDAPFNPLPLRRVLAQMGFSSRAAKMGDSHWRISLQRDGQGRVEGGPTPEDCQGLPDVGAPVFDDAEGTHIDVRGLQPPGPMVAVLRLCAAVAPGTRIIVHLDRNPVHLYPELAEIGWTYLTLPGDPGEVRLLLQRDGH